MPNYDLNPLNYYSREVYVDYFADGVVCILDLHGKKNCDVLFMKMSDV